MNKGKLLFLILFLIRQSTFFIANNNGHLLGKQRARQIHKFVLIYLLLFGNDVIADLESASRYKNDRLKSIKQSQQRR